MKIIVTGNCDKCERALTIRMALPDGIVLDEDEGLTFNLACECDKDEPGIIEMNFEEAQ